MESAFDHVWYWHPQKVPGRTIDRKSHRCRVLAQSSWCSGKNMNSVLVEFPDGYRVVTSRYAVRKAA